MNGIRDGNMYPTVPVNSGNNILPFPSEETYYDSDNNEYSTPHTEQNEDAGTEAVAHNGRSDVNDSPKRIRSILDADILLGIISLTGSSRLTLIAFNILQISLNTIYSTPSNRDEHHYNEESRMKKAPTYSSFMRTYVPYLTTTSSYQLKI